MQGYGRDRKMAFKINSLEIVVWGALEREGGFGSEEEGFTSSSLSGSFS